MSETVIADFVARFVTDETRGEPIEGRVVLSQRRLVLATGSGKTTVPLESIFDVSVGYVPPNLEEFFQDTITLAYRQGDSRSVVVVEAGSEEVARFKTVLFKALLNGTKVRVNHPARIGGRVTDGGYRTATLAVRPETIAFVETDESFEIELATVTHFERIERDVGAETRPVISVRHASEGRAVTTEIAIRSDRKMNVLGRYVRLEYSEIRSELSKIEVSEQEIETLVAIYTHGDVTSAAKMLGADSSAVTMLLSDLREKELLVENEEGLGLTARGRLVVSKRIEDVNA